MNAEIRNKIAAVYRLVNQGVDGEREAAKLALDRLMKKYNLNVSELESIEYGKYSFKYSTVLEEMLMLRLVVFFLPESSLDNASKSTYKVRQVNLRLTYAEYITIDCAYEYFRRHMKAQWKLHCSAQLSRVRSAKRLRQLREDLQELFFSRYVIASKLYLQGELVSKDASKMNKEEIKHRYSLMGVEGGSYNKQVITGKLLN